MADFKTHISAGIVLSIIYSIAIASLNMISGGITLVFTAISMIVGSLLPDLDSDSGLPFKITFSFFGIIAGYFSLIWISVNYPDIGWRLLILTPFAVFIFIYFLVGWIFKKFTHHRGIFHSTPMMAISILATLFIANNFSNFEKSEKMLIAAATGIGFLGHLILDELYSTINLVGGKFRSKKGLGNTFKLWSSSLITTFFVYAVLILFIIFVI